MRSLYLNKLSVEERQELVDSLLSAQSKSCFICLKPIDEALHRNNMDIDHVEPLTTGGKDGPGNFAVTHASCNRSKQASDLRVARVLATFNAIAETVEGRSPNLADVLAKYNGAKYDLPASVENSSLRISLPDVGQNEILSFPIHKDDVSGFHSVFLDLPIEYLHHDDHINPRSIGKNLNKLVTEFHRKLPQLHIALGWLNCSNGEPSRVQLFDGQHKAAAQILLGTRRLPVRVFINPDIDVLLTANTHAGTTLRQVAFDKSVQRSLGNALLEDRITRYQREHGMDEDNESFTEQGLVNYFKGESREMKRYVLDGIRHSITAHPDNKLSSYIEYGGRGTGLPLSYSTVEKTFYSFFIYSDLLTTSFNYKFEEGANPRQIEIEQVVRLMNIIAEHIFIGQFELGIGTSQIENKVSKGIDVPEPHLRAYRMAKEEIIYNWLRYIRQLVQTYFVMNGLPMDENRLFQYQIPDTCWENIERFVIALAKLPVWVNKTLPVFGGKRNNDYWQSIFETGQTPDSPPVEVMPSGIKINEMIQED